VLSCHKSDLSSHQWLGTLDSIPLSSSGVSLDITAHLVVNQDLSLSESTTTTILSVKDFDLGNKVFLVEGDLPPLTLSFFGVGEFVWSHECPVCKVGSVTVV